LRRDPVEQRQRVGNEGLLARRAGGAAESRVVEQVESMVGKRGGQAGHAARDVFGVAAEIDQGVRPVVGANRGEHLPPAGGQGQERRAGGRCARLREVDQRALQHEHREAHADVGDGDAGDDHEEPAGHGAEADELPATAHLRARTGRPRR
jgi:hypothetical protein